MSDLNYYKNYSKILLNYTLFFIFNLKTCDNEKYIINLYIKGLNMIKIIYFSNFNKYKSYLELYNVCDKSYIYYIEFINQILNNNLTVYTNDDSNKLSLNDAIIFCYKKLLHNDFFSNNINNNNKIKDRFFFISDILSILNEYYLTLYVDKIYSYINIINNFDNLKNTNTHSDLDINKKINNNLSEHNTNIISFINKKNLNNHNKIKNINNYFLLDGKKNLDNNDFKEYESCNDVKELVNKIKILNNFITQSIKEINNNISKL